MASAQGVNIVGYLNHVIGLGETCRQFVDALRSAGVPFAPAALDLGPPVPRVAESEVPWLAEAPLPFETTILWCNPDRYGIDVDPRSLPGRTKVARWAWELAELPARWREAASLFDEIWTPSPFVRDAVAANVSVPARVMPPAVSQAPAAPLDRDAWRLPNDRPLFLFMFDYHSTVIRKNPQGLMTAFSRAFPEGDEAALLIKTINATAQPGEAEALELSATRHPGISILDVAVPEGERAALLGGCDCYASLHRSEGFGMTIAEAMSRGRPVVATNFGGCSELLDERSAFPVRWQPSPVEAENAVYPVTGSWAEPDLDHAARMMRYVVEHPAEARARGRVAAERIASAHSPEAVGRIAAGELSRLGR